jgi:hypothetical protein
VAAIGSMGTSGPGCLALKRQFEAESAAANFPSSDLASFAYVGPRRCRVTVCDRTDVGQDPQRGGRDRKHGSPLADEANLGSIASSTRGVAMRYGERRT